MTVDIEKLQEKRVSDLGCGNGRWSYFLKDKCREIILVDFSDEHILINVEFFGYYRKSNSSSDWEKIEGVSDKAVIA